MSAPSNSSGSDIAVVGMAGRWPGAESLDQFWRNISQGTESVRRFTDAELRKAGESEDLLGDPDYVRARPVLDNVDMFDAGFFGFSPQDAAIMDPQHRLFLEVGWESLEHAGHDPSRFAGQVGVFATCGMNTYMMYHLVTNQRIMDTVGEWLVRHTGNDMNFLATRLSYQLDLKGPSMNVQSACSSALVAIHLASQSLLNGECDMALAGGSVIALPQDRGYLHKKGEILSPDGHCRPFDATAAGTLFGSGAGVVVLRRLADALADGDQVYAVIKGSAVNNDGSTKVGYLAPSVEGQARAITEALAIGGIDPETVSYVEAHGTGTLVGDPIEITAITEAFRQYTSKVGYCAIGSLKSNIGHLGEAAGVAGFIKTVLSLQHRQIPPSINFTAPNPRIDFATSPFVVNTALREWSAADGPRRAGITSLGAGGTNCHVIVEEAPDIAPSQAASRPEQLLLLSAKTATAVERSAHNLADWIEVHPGASLADVAYTLQVGRKTHSHRRAVVCHDRDQAIAALRQEGRTTSEAGARARSTAFLFPGQGSQYAQMGRQLYEGEPVFRREFDTCDRLYTALRGTSLASVIYPADGSADARLDETAFTQPALFAVEYALARLWMSWGVQPDAMIGHSIGEYVAACLAGVFSLPDAVGLVAARGALMQGAARGAMLSVSASAASVESTLQGTSLSLAASNAPELCVVSGPEDAIARIESDLQRREIATRRLRTSHAFHSGMMEPVLDRFADSVRAVALNVPSLPFVSNVTGDWIRPEQATDPQYWVNHLRGTVRFNEGLATILRQPNQACLEVGPGRTLTTLTREQASKPPVVLSSMRHPQDSTSDVTTILTALGGLWSAGITPDWAAVHGHERRRRVALPTYPFERSRHWVDAGPSHNVPAPVAETVPSTDKKPDIADWFYVPTWHATHDIPPSASISGDVLIFDDDNGIASAAVGRAIAAHSSAAQTFDSSPRRLEFPTPGDIDAAHLVPCDVASPAPHEVRIRVSAAALNFADVLKVTGLQPDAPFGMECAGVIESVGSTVTSVNPGDQVVAIGPGSFQTHVVRDARFVARTPAGLSATDAATVPAAFMTALYALEDIGRLQRGERVLIHAASGGVGLAAVQIAQQRGAEVFATAGSAEKRAYLASIGIRHVFPSRTLEFAEAIKQETDGRGIDVVLNSLVGDFIPRSLGLLGPGGRFLEIGKKEIYSPEQLAGLSLAANVSYHPIDLTRTLRDEPDLYGRLLAECVARITTGVFRPLPHHDFAAVDAVSGFRLMAEARHIGKVVLDFSGSAARTYVVSRGPQFAASDASRFVLNPSQAPDYVALLEAIGPAAASIAHIIYAWPLDAPARSATVDSQLADCFFGPLRLAQAIGRQELTQGITLSFVTSGSVDVSGETPIAPVTATILGPSLVLPRELPNVATRVIDIGPSPTAAQRDRLSTLVAAELVRPASEPVVALRLLGRWVQRFEHHRLERPPSVRLRPRGVYLVTGGTGGLGLEIAERLAVTQQARLILVGRTALPPRPEWSQYLTDRAQDAAVADRVRKILACEAAGAQVLIETADVADVDDMRRVLAHATHAFGPIHGVFHTAGTLDDGLMQLKTRESALSVFRPKVQGTLVLDEVLGTTPLDFIALFSSVSSVFGLQGQVDYTAANAFLDAFAVRKTAEGRTAAVSIGWGPWRDVGLAAAASRRRQHGSDRRPTHPWLERVQRTAAGDTEFSTSLSRERQWVIGDHVVRGGDAVLPGTGYLELIRGALAETPQDKPIELSQVFFEAPLIVLEGETKDVNIKLSPDGGRFDVSVSSSDGVHASGKAAYSEITRPAQIDVAAIEQRCQVRRDTPHGLLDQPFMDFGPHWANVEQVSYGKTEALIRLALPATLASDVTTFGLHPALLDMATGAAQGLIPGFAQATDFYVPFSYGRLRLFGGLSSRLVSHVRLAAGTNPSIAVFDVTIADTEGTVLVDIDGFCMKRATGAGFSAGPAATAPAAARPSSATTSGLLADDMLRHGIGRDEGLDALERIISLNAGPRVLVSTGDLGAWRARVDAQARADNTAVALPSTDVSTTTHPASGRRESRGSQSADATGDVESRLSRMWSDLLGVSAIGPDDNFFEIGGHSLLAVRLLTRIEKTFQRSVPLQALFTNGTVRQLATLIRGDEAPADASYKSPIIVPITEAPGPTFYCVHSLGGEVMSFLSLARALGPTQRFCGLQAPLNEDVEQLTTSIESLASRYVKELLQLQPDGPYYLGGWSAGSTIALEMAQQMQELGKPVELLVLLDGAPFNGGAGTPVWDPRYAARLIGNLPYWIKDDLLDNFSFEEFSRRVRTKVTALARRSTTIVRQKKNDGADAVGGFIDMTSWSPQEQRFMKRLFAILERYRPKPYSGRVLLYQARTEPLYHLFEVDKVWRHLAKDVEVVSVTGTHISLIQRPHVETIAAHLRRRLHPELHG